MGKNWFYSMIWGKLALPYELRWFIRWLFSNRKFIVGAVAIVTDDEGRVLFFRHTYSDPLPWGLPATVVKYEDVKEALAKKIKEESGLEIEVDYLIGVIHGKKRRIDLPFHATIVGGEFRPSADVDQYSYFSIKEVDRIEAGQYPRSILTALSSPSQCLDSEINPWECKGFIELLEKKSRINYSNASDGPVREEIKMLEKRGNKVVFANDKTRRAWEAVQRANEYAQTIPPERPPLDLEPISFDKDIANVGQAVVMTQGLSVSTGEKGVLLVPSRTRRILDHLRIPYNVMS